MVEKKKTIDATEVFQSLQAQATECNAGKCRFSMKRADGWRWAFEVVAPGEKEDDDTDDK